MGRHLHPCLCGFIPESNYRLKKHRTGCKTWRERPDPQSTALVRRWATWRELRGEVSHSKCPECKRPVGRHWPGCSFSQEELSRKILLIKHEIDPGQFEVFLRVLAQRYERKAIH